ncbi:MAG: hypothetical protein A2284_15625 [Deltaproteobacteria bacterium RIFOXYA12_FULL_61_11]|nr:MAG: hypothetical protein A2284_15625 [Deltaproteobacteria bacterium RIFOXYA12_FULL_61_11]
MENKEIMSEVVSCVVANADNFKLLGGADAVPDLMLSILKHLDAYDRYKDPQCPREERERLAVQYPRLKGI